MSSINIIVMKDLTEKDEIELRMNEAAFGGNERSESEDRLPRTKKMKHSATTSTRCQFDLWNRKIPGPTSRPPTKSAPRRLMSSIRVRYASRPNSEQ